MDAGFKRTLTYCYFLFMIGFMIIYGVEFKKFYEENKKTDDDQEEVYSANKDIERLDMEYILYSDIYNDVFNYRKYLKDGKASECFYDTENAKSIKETIESIINTYKTNLENGSYYYYGFAADMDFCEFFNTAINELSYYEVSSTDDIYVYYAYIYGYNNLYNEVITIEGFNDYLAKEYYADTLDSYLYMEGFHLLICKKNGANVVSTSDYTEDEKTLALELYDKIYAITKLIVKDEDNGVTIKDFFTRMADLFSNGNFAAPSVELSQYLNLNGTSGSDFEKYYLAELTVVTEDLTIQQGQMVDEFEAACREIYSTQMDRLVSEITVNEETIHDEVILTTYGYHLYVNESSSIKGLMSDDELICISNKVHFAMFIDEYNNSSDEDYVTPAGLYSGYRKATDEANGEEAASWISKIYDYIQTLELKSLDNITMENVESEFIDKYLKTYTNYEKLVSSLGEEESINYDSIKHNSAIYYGNYYFYASVFSKYSGANNFDYIRYGLLLDNLDSYDLGENKEAVRTQLETNMATLYSKLEAIHDKTFDFEYGLFEKLNKEMYDDLMEHFEVLKNARGE